MSIGTAKDSSSIRTPISLQRLSASIRFNGRRRAKLDSSIGTIPDTDQDSNGVKLVEQVNLHTFTEQVPSAAPEEPRGDEPAVSCQCRSSDGNNVDLVLTVNQANDQTDHLPATRVLFRSPEAAGMQVDTAKQSEHNFTACGQGECLRTGARSEVQHAVLKGDIAGSFLVDTRSLCVTFSA